MVKLFENKLDQVVKPFHRYLNKWKQRNLGIRAHFWIAFKVFAKNELISLVSIL